MSIFVSDLARFNAIGLFGRADFVALISRVQDACEIEGASVGLIESQSASDANDLALETMRR